MKFFAKRSPFIPFKIKPIRPKPIRSSAYEPVTQLLK